MRERAIPFSGQMVRAVLEGRKTQTRRVVKDMPSIALPGVVRLQCELHPFSRKALEGTPAENCEGPDRLSWVAEDWCGNPIGIEEFTWLKCPYGQPGERLWVREAWRTEIAGPVDDFPGSALDPTTPLIYEADGPWSDNHSVGRYRHARFMPRWASRITLEITAVRVERLQDISRGNCMAEGCPFPNMAKGPNPRDWYADLWRSLNGPESWDANPWVCVIEFKRVEA